MIRKWLVVSIVIVSLFLWLPGHTFAAETATTDTVYVAGNPDLFPFEYYDSRSGSYQGILPELYEQISRTTGLEFVYIRPGILNHQSRLAKNGQVDLVSAHVRGQIEAAEREVILLKYDGNREICVGFTTIAPKQIENSVRTALENLSSQQILDLARQIPEPQPELKLYLWTGSLTGILLLIIAALSIALLRIRNERKKNDANRSTDLLTGIGNNVYFENTYRHCITHAGYALYYVSYISLNIQRIIQYWGISKAEELQRYAANVLSQAALDADFPARVDDGVFLMAFQAPSQDAAALRITEILNQLNHFEGDFLEKHRSLFRAGVFWIDSGSLPPETAVFNARQGYLAAAQNRISYVFADKIMLNQAATTAELHRKLARALDNREFMLFLQMIVEPDGRIAGAESLTRWQSREDGLLSPAVFIEPLKSAGLIDKLDFYILEEACRQLERWNLSGKGHLWISCNFTRLTMSRNDFVERFQEILERYQFSPSQLFIELTEDSLMDNSTVAYRNMLECKNMGCQVALDDLGSGNSSLQDLYDYPIDMLKVDRHILLKSSSPRGNALLQGLIKLGHDMGMKVLCEGVETEEENLRVRSAGCDYIQGFYYSRVLPREEADLFYTRMQNARQEQ